MSVIKVVDVLKDTSYMLTDEGAVRWSKSILLNWFNEAQSALVVRRPDSLAANESFSCGAGTKQNLPAIGLRLIDITRVMGGGAITRVSRARIDSHISDWHALPETSDIHHYIYDDRDPKIFYTYPPATAGTSIEIIYSKAPEKIVISDFSTDTQVLSVDDIYANAIQEYILYKAWMKDAETAGNTGRAQAHFTQFRNAIGDKSEADAMMSPTNG